MMAEISSPLIREAGYIHVHVWPYGGRRPAGSGLLTVCPVWSRGVGGCYPSVSQQQPWKQLHNLAGNNVVLSVWHALMCDGMPYA